MSILSIPIIDWKSGHHGSRTIYFPTQSNGREPANDVDSIQSNMLQQISYSTGELLWRQQKQRLCKVMGNGFPREKSTWLMRLSQFVFMYRDNWLIQELGQQNSSFVYFIPNTHSRKYGNTHCAACHSPCHLALHFIWTYLVLWNEWQGLNDR